MREMWCRLRDSIDTFCRATGRLRVRFRGRRFPRGWKTPREFVVLSGGPADAQIVTTDKSIHSIRIPLQTGTAARYFGMSTTYEESRPKFASILYLRTPNIRRHLHVFDFHPFDLQASLRVDTESFDKGLESAKQKLGTAP